MRRTTPHSTIRSMRFRCPSPHPPVDFATLCRLLELEIQLGRQLAFRARLRRALEQAQASVPSRSTTFK